MYEVLVVDDHAIVAFGLQMLLKNTDFASNINTACNGDKAIEMLRQKRYDLVIMEINIPNTDSLGLLSLMIINWPEIRILIFSMNPEEIFAKRYFKLGALGYLTKDSPTEEVLRAIARVMVHYKNYFSEDMMQLMYYDQTHQRKENPFNKLSDREFEVTMHLLKGESLSELSFILKLHTSTVGTQGKRI